MTDYVVEHDTLDTADSGWLENATVIGPDGYEVFTKPADDYPDWIRSRVPRPAGWSSHTERGRNQ